MGPWVVWASKSGAVFPSLRLGICSIWMGENAFVKVKVKRQHIEMESTYLWRYTMVAMIVEWGG